MNNWTRIVEKMTQEVQNFASSKLSGREFYRQAQLNGVGGAVRSLLRDRGVVEARQLARKALKRRGILV